jgi:hypothetical protein
MNLTEKLDEARSIIRELLEESTYPAYAGEDCRSCDSPNMGHNKDCPYEKAVNRALEFLAKPDY